MSGAELFDSLAEAFHSNRMLAGKIALISLLVWLVYAALMFMAVARMSPDYFLAREPASGSWRRRHPLVRWSGHVAKNLVGLPLLLAGLAMLPLPGPGVLTIVVALSLLDFPGKRRLVLRIVRERHVRRSIDWIRVKAGRPPILLPEDVS